MKILMIPTWYTAHNEEVMTAGIFHYEQAIALKKYADVAMYFPYDYSLKTTFYKAEERGLLTYRSGWKNKLFKYVLYIVDFMRIRKEFNPDIIHAHVALGAGKIAIVLGKIFNIPVVITEHSPVELMHFENKKNIKRAGFVYKESAMNVCVSKHLKDSLSGYFPNVEMKVIYNGIVQPRTIEICKPMYRIEGKINCCIAAAFYNKDIKGYQYLIPAVKAVYTKGMDIVLHICGGGEYLEYYKQLAEELQISKNCVFYGQCDKEKVYAIMQEMDYCISASIFESAGVSVQEAMLVGKPVLVTKSGGANSLVTDETAIVIDKGSEDALVEGLFLMKDRINLFDKDRIQTYAYENFEINQVSRRYMELYEALLKV